jgi:hypothetical protein
MDDRIKTETITMAEAEGLLEVVPDQFSDRPPEDVADGFNSPREKGEWIMSKTIGPTT